MSQARAELQTRFIEHVNISECIFLKVKPGRIQGLARIQKKDMRKNTCKNNYK